MRKWLLFCMLAALLVSPACALSQGQSMQVTRITDGAMTLGRCAAPVDYVVQSDAFWCGATQSLSYPVQFAVTATSPDGRTAMSYLSAHDYVQLVNASFAGATYAAHQDGAMDETTLTPMLTLMSVDGYEDYLITGLYPDRQINVVAQEEVTPHRQALMDERANAKYQAAIQLFSASREATVDGCYYGAIERLYSFDVEGEPYYASVVCAVDALQYSLCSVTSGVEMSSTTIAWAVPFSYLLVTPQSDYEAARANFETFVQNTTASDEFYAVCQRASDRIRNDVLKSRSLSGAVSTVQSTFSDSLSGNDSYDEERFTDYLFDQNDYTLSDGDHVKVSTGYDYVYEDDRGNVYFTNSALDEPAGMTRLQANR